MCTDNVHCWIFTIIIIVWETAIIITMQLMDVLTERFEIPVLCSAAVAMERNRLRAARNALALIEGGIVDSFGIFGRIAAFATSSSLFGFRGRNTFCQQMVLLAAEKPPARETLFSIVSRVLGMFAQVFGTRPGVWVGFDVASRRSIRCSARRPVERQILIRSFLFRAFIAIQG